MKKIVIASGGFDPLHSGHISYLKAAKALGDILVVGCNSNEWLIRKKGRYFLPWTERSIIIQALKPVDYAAGIYDDFDGSSIALIKDVMNAMLVLRGEELSFIFANGGDRTKDNILEMNGEYPRPVSFIFGVGGATKLNSSSKLLEEWSKNTP